MKFSFAASIFLLGITTSSAQTQAPIEWETSVNGTITDIHYHGGWTYAFAKEPCAIYGIQSGYQYQAYLIYSCQEESDVQINGFAPVVAGTQPNRVDYFILMIEQGRSSGLPSGQNVFGRMTRVGALSGQEAWSVPINPNIFEDQFSWHEDVTPLARTSCCSQPRETDNVYVNLYSVKDNSPYLAAYSVSNGSLVFGVVQTAYQGNRFGGLFASSSGKFSIIFSGIDGDYLQEVAVASFDAEDGNIISNFTMPASSSNLPGIPAPGFVDWDTDLLHISDKSVGNIALSFPDLTRFRVGNSQNFLAHPTTTDGNFLFGVRKVGDEIQPAAYNPLQSLSNEIWRFEGMGDVSIASPVYESQNQRLFYLSEDSWYGLDRLTGAPDARFVNAAGDKNSFYRVQPGSNPFVIVAGETNGNYWVKAYNSDPDPPTPAPSMVPSMVPTMVPTMVSVESGAPTAPTDAPTSGTSFINTAAARLMGALLAVMMYM